MIQERIQELKSSDKLSYPRIHHNIPPTRIPDFREKFEKVERQDLQSLPTDAVYAVHGRVMAVRRHGSKLAFIDIRHDFRPLQVMVDLGRLERDGHNVADVKDLLKVLKRGDAIAVTGIPAKSHAGELSILAKEIPQLLSPAIAPLPVKLTDEETRVQNRHMELLINQDAVNILRMRSEILRAMRHTLQQACFTEVSTPILAANAGGAIARPFVTHATELGEERELALRVAPELWLKRLVVAGVDKVYEIGPAFRNEGIDATHNPEFTVCEFYESYASLERLIAFTMELLRDMVRACDLFHEQSGMAAELPSQRLHDTHEMIEFVPVLEEKLGFAFPDLEDEEGALTQLRRLLQSHSSLPASLNERAMQRMSLPQLLDRLAGLYLETSVADPKTPLFITHHPACMSPLAKLFRCPKTNQLVAARAELFVGGMEIANMYEEENDPFEQRRRMVAQAETVSRRRKKGGVHIASSDDDEAAPFVDEQYIQVLQSGLPPTGGWGCGVERLVMLMTGATRITDCLPFGTLRNVVALAAGGKNKSG
jgi:lysyl-tRNA synthetase class 2